MGAQYTLQMCLRLSRFGCSMCVELCSGLKNRWTLPILAVRLTARAASLCSLLRLWKQRTHGRDKMHTSTSEEIRAAVHQVYGAMATQARSGCWGGTSYCGAAESTSRQLGYAGADSSHRSASRRSGIGAVATRGERLLDFWSGAGFDALLPARQVGPHWVCDRRGRDPRDSGRGCLPRVGRKALVPLPRAKRRLERST